MRFVAFEDGQSGAVGVRVRDEVVNLTAEGLPTTLDELLLLGTAGLDAAQRAVARARTRLRLTDIKHLPPLHSPAKALAVGLNYRDHAAEANFQQPFYPVLFHRFPSSWVGHKTPILRPAVSEQFDYEGELVAVIGTPGRYIEPSKALDHVVGYAIFNDGSVRDYQFRSGQWMIGKNFDRSGAFGPEFVTADELPPGAVGLRLQTRLNGQVMQAANTRDMIFDVASLIAACSESFWLRPGDIVITGTPSGVGFARKPPVFMRAGDVCEVEIEGLGVLSNPIADED